MILFDNIGNFDPGFDFDLEFFGTLNAEIVGNKEALDPRRRPR